MSDSFADTLDPIEYGPTLDEIRFGSPQVAIDLNKLLDDVENNINVPLRNSNTPYTDAINLLTSIGRFEPFKLLNFLPKDIILLNPEFEDVVQTKMLALEAYIHVRDVSFTVFDDVFQLSKTDPEILCDIYSKVFENITYKVMPVQQFFNSWLKLSVQDASLTTFFMIQIFFKVCPAWCNVKRL